MQRKRSPRKPGSRLPAYRLSAKRLLKAMPEALRAARHRAGMTQVDVGREAAIASEVYGRMERGEILPSLPTLLRLCEAVQAMPEELLGLAPVSAKLGAAEATLSKTITHLNDTPELRRLLRALIGMPNGRIRIFAELALATRGGRR
jgi:DNA-binding XRE family transcriptional regulator